MKMDSFLEKGEPPASHQRLLQGTPWLVWTFQLQFKAQGYVEFSMEGPEIQKWKGGLTDQEIPY